MTVTEPTSTEPTLTDCERYLLRQFDADCAAGMPMPADVATHLAGCDSCRSEWQQSQELDAALRDAIRVDVPMALYRRAYLAAVDDLQPSPSPARRWMRLLVAGLSGAAAAGVSLWLPTVSEWIWLAPAAFIVVAASVYLYDYYDECQLPSV